MWEREFRVKSPRRILEEMEALYLNYGFKVIDFIHDNFTTSRKFVLDFSRYLQVHNRYGLQWGASSRTDCLDIPRIEMMRAAGLFGLFFGVETGSVRMQEIIRKNLNLDKFLEVLERGNRLGVRMTTAFILGFPEEERGDIDATMRRALEYKALGTDRVFFSKLSVLSGTDLHHQFGNELEENLTVQSSCPENYHWSYLQELISQHPDLFSSFYHVPHPKFSKEYLSKLTEFSHLLVNGDAVTALRVMDERGLSPSQVFEEWQLWADRLRIPYYDYRRYSSDEFREDFISFLGESGRNLSLRGKKQNSGNGISVSTWENFQ